VSPVASSAHDISVMQRVCVVVARDGALLGREPEQATRREMLERIGE
jgi:hypothetical protein